MNLTISGYSTALFSTWYFIDELALLLDAGDGVVSNLLQKSRKVKHIFITHADRDHCTGLLQFNQLNARNNYPKIYYPKDCGSFPFLADFSKKFDPHVKSMEWTGIETGTEISIQKNIVVKGLENKHVFHPILQHKSLSFQVFQTKRKLKSEYIGLKGSEIQKLRQAKKEITTEVRTLLLSYSGDTPVEFDGRWNGSEVLIHEATFLSNADMNTLKLRGHKHSSLEDVLKMVAASNVKKLVLGHFSSRYKAAEIDAAILKYIKRYKISIPVYRVLPGIYYKNILENPIG